MKERASEAEPLQSAGGKGADLTVEGFLQLKLSSELRNATATDCGREVIQPAEKVKVFARRETGIKALIGAGMVTELAANGARRRDRVKTCN